MDTKELIKALSKAGHRESALLLKNWGEKDEVAKAFEKSIRKPDTSSKNTDPSVNPALGGKYGKVHGGDPRKSTFQDDHLVENVKGKPRVRVSGASDLRTEKDLPNEQGEYKD